MIQFLGVTKLYHQQSGQPLTALDNVSFEIDAGEFVFIVGPSGSGKTSILRHIIREELPSEGRIYFEDADITKLKQNGVYKLRRQIGTVFQDYKLIEEKNAYENIAFAMEAAGMKKKEILETVPYLLEIVNLADRGDAFPTQLSGGEKQRVAIARAIANNPKVLIADEPTGNLDPEAAWEVVQVLTKVNKWGTTVIMSTHGSEIVNTLQKRVLKMANGKLVRDEKKGRYEDADKYSLKGSASPEPETDATPKADAQPETAEELAKSEFAEKIEDMEEEIEEEKEVTAEKSAKTSKKSKTADSEKSEVDTDKDVPETIAELVEAQAKPDEPVEEEIRSELEKADAADISILKLRPEMQAKLVKAGYKDVEDILRAGIAAVNEKLSKAEIRELAKSVKKFLTTE